MKAWCEIVMDNENNARDRGICHLFPCNNIYLYSPCQSNNKEIASQLRNCEEPTKSQKLNQIKEHL